MNQKTLLGWVPPVLEAWKTSGKKNYTWKTNRTPFWLGMVILALLVGGNYGYQHYTKQITLLKEEVKALKATKETASLAIKQLTLDKEALLKSNSDNFTAMEKLHGANLKLSDNLSACRLDVKQIELEKRNVENLLIASSNQTKDLKGRLKELLDFAQIHQNKRHEDQAELRRLYNELQQ